MLQSRLLAVFRNFSKDELKRFEAFLLSPYFNQSVKMVKFFGLIAPHQPLFDSHKLEKENLYKALHGKSAYNDMTMRKLISDMLKLAKTFIAQESLLKDELQASVYRYKWLTVHHIEKLIGPELETRRLLLESQMQRDDDYYHHQWQYELHKFKMTAERLRGAEHKFIKHFDLFVPVHSHNRNYLVGSFWLHIYLLNLGRIYNFPLDESLLNPIEALAPLYTYKGDTIIDIFFCIYQLLKTEKEEWFFELKETFLRKDNSVPIILMREACVAMENYCIKKIREGEDRFMAEVMQIYRLEAENELYLQNGVMDTIYYYNVAIRGTDSGQVEWAEHFVENYKKYLSDEYREDSYYYAKAHILFARKKYKEALRLALSCDIPFFTGKITIKVLVARIHYELGMLDEIPIELEAARHHLKDGKMSEERRQFFQTFLTLMRHLCDLKIYYSPEKCKQLLDHIDAHKAFPNRKWILEKVNELQRSAQ